MTWTIGRNRLEKTKILQIEVTFAIIMNKVTTVLGICNFQIYSAEFIFNSYVIRIEQVFSEERTLSEIYIYMLFSVRIFYNKK